MARYCKENLSHLVFPDKVAFFKQDTMQFNQLLLVAFITDSSTGFQDFLAHNTLLLAPNSHHRPPYEVTWL